MTAETLDLPSLVRDDAVHQSVYTDPAIFALEVGRIFKCRWR